MSWNYSCPKCKAILNPDQSIILTAVHGTTNVLIGFHPEPGNYRVYLPPDIKAEEGSRWDFFCPVCQENLVSAADNNLCELDVLEAGNTQRLFFSRVAGEQATFVVYDEQVKETHGKDVPKYDPVLNQLKYIRY